MKNVTLFRLLTAYCFAACATATLPGAWSNGKPQGYMLIPCITQTPGQPPVILLPVVVAAYNQTPAQQHIAPTAPQLHKKPQKPAAARLPSTAAAASHDTSLPLITEPETGTVSSTPAPCAPGCCCRFWTDPRLYTTDGKPAFTSIWDYIRLTECMTAGTLQMEAAGLAFHGTSETQYIKALQRIINDDQAKPLKTFLTCSKVPATAINDPKVLTKAVHGIYADTLRCLLESPRVLPQTINRRNETGATLLHDVVTTCFSTVDKINVVLQCPRFTAKNAVDAHNQTALDVAVSRVDTCNTCLLNMERGIEPLDPQERLLAEATYIASQRRELERYKEIVAVLRAAGVATSAELGAISKA